VGITSVSLDKWIKKIVAYTVCTMDYYSALKRKETLSFVMTWGLEMWLKWYSTLLASASP
jgi:hypothetical protein